MVGDRGLMINIQMYHDVSPRLDDCKLTEKCFEVVASALSSAHSILTEIDLSHNDLQKSEERLLRGVLSQHCKLESLRSVCLCVRLCVC